MMTMFLKDIKDIKDWMIKLDRSIDYHFGQQEEMADQQNLAVNAIHEMIGALRCAVIPLKEKNPKKAKKRKKTR